MRFKVVLDGRPFLIFRSLKDQVERFSISGQADNPDAMVTFHGTLKGAVRDAEAERDRSTQDGWQLYHAE
jgi:hypothetical protein